MDIYTTRHPGRESEARVDRDPDAMNGKPWYLFEIFRAFCVFRGRNDFSRLMVAHKGLLVEMWVTQITQDIVFQKLNFHSRCCKLIQITSLEGMVSVSIEIIYLKIYRSGRFCKSARFNAGIFVQTKRGSRNDVNQNLQPGAQLVVKLF